MTYRKYLTEQREHDCCGVNEKGETVHIDVDFNVNANVNGKDSVNANIDIDHDDKKGKRLRGYKYFAQGAPTLILGVLGLLVGLDMLNKIQRDFEYKPKSKGSLSWNGRAVDFCAHSFCDENANADANETCPCPFFSLEKEKVNECGQHCGIITCPDFTTVSRSASESESGSGSKLCSLLCKCKRGRSSAVGLVLTSVIFQIILVATYFSAWFVDCFDKGVMLCLFLFAHLIFLFLSSLTLLTSWNFNMGQIPQNVENFMNQDGNSVGVLFVTWAWMNSLLSGGSFGVVLYYICLYIFPLNPNTNL